VPGDVIYKKPIQLGQLFVRTLCQINHGKGDFVTVKIVYQKTSTVFQNNVLETEKRTGHVAVRNTRS